MGLLQAATNPALPGTLRATPMPSHPLYKCLHIKTSAAALQKTMEAADMVGRGQTQAPLMTIAQHGTQSQCRLVYIAAMDSQELGIQGTNTTAEREPRGRQDLDIALKLAHWHPPVTCVSNTYSHQMSVWRLKYRQGQWESLLFLRRSNFITEEGSIRGCGAARWVVPLE